MINKIKDQLADTFFNDYDLEEPYHEEFFQFCVDDDDFIVRCKAKNNLQILEFLKEKHLTYIQNSREEKN